MTPGIRPMNRLMSEKPHLAGLSIPCPPPPSYSPTFALASSFFPSTLSPRREIIMGGLVSPGPVIEGEVYDEKRGMSIEVPGIVLTEPELTRSPSPPPKSILLLPPTSLPLPTESPTREQPFSPGFRALLNADGRSLSGLGTVTVRSLVLLLFLGIGGWHLWSTMRCGGDEVVEEF